MNDIMMASTENSVWCQQLSAFGHCKKSMHACMQVVNRDLSIAVLRHFQQLRKEEIQSGVLKKSRRAKLPIGSSGKQQGGNTPSSEVQSKNKRVFMMNRKNSKSGH